MSVTTSTFAMLKPDAVEGKHVGEIISRIEAADISIAWMNLRRLTSAEAEELYAEHQSMPFYNRLLQFTTSGPVVLMKLTYYGDRDAVKAWRLLLGATDPRKASPGTIRHDYAANAEMPCNVAHGSDSLDAAERELNLFCP